MSAPCRPYDGVDLTPRELQLAEFLYAKGKTGQLERLVNKKKAKAPLRDRNGSPDFVTERRKPKAADEDVEAWLASKRKDRETAAMAFTAECALQRAAELALELDRVQAEFAAYKASATQIGRDLSARLEATMARALVAEANNVAGTNTGIVQHPSAAAAAAQTTAAPAAAPPTSQQPRTPMAATPRRSTRLQQQKHD